MEPTTPPCEENLVTEAKTREQNIRGDSGASHQDSALLTGVSQTRQEDDTTMVYSMKPKRRTRVASWNVRTLYQTGKLAQIVKFTHKIRLSDRLV